MLNPEFYANCADEVLDLYGKFETKVMRDIVRRLIKTGYTTDTAKRQVEVLLQSGELYDEIIQEVSAISGESEEIIKNIFEDAGIDTTKNDFKHVGLSPEGAFISPVAEQIIDAGVIKTNGLVNNLTMTTALSAQTAYIDACALAELEVSSGAFDYNTAIRHAINEAAEQGLCVHYPSGHVDKLDVAIRRAVMTGVTQTTSQVSLANCDTIGTDLVEVSAHGGARPDHAEWQGKIYCLTGNRGKYKDFYKATGYGTGSGLCGWNCRHSFFPFLEGVSTPAYTKKEIKRINDETVKYNGEEIPLYEAEQRQRAMERQIRKERRGLATFDEAIKQSTGNLQYEMKAEFDSKALEMKSHELAYKDFSRQTGLMTQKERLQVKGFNRSISQKSVHGAKRVQKSIEKSNESGIMLLRNMERKTQNIGDFSELKIPMHKKTVKKICKENGLDITDVKIKIQRNKDALGTGYYGSTDYDNVGRIDLLPDAFTDEEQLLRTIIHEKRHVEQIKQHGKSYCLEHLTDMEKDAYSYEDLIFESLKRKKVK